MSGSTQQRCQLTTQYRDLGWFFTITNNLIWSIELFFYPSKNYSFIYTRLFERAKNIGLVLFCKSVMDRTSNLLKKKRTKIIFSQTLTKIFFRPIEKSMVASGQSPSVNTRAQVRYWVTFSGCFRENLTRILCSVWRKKRFVLNKSFLLCHIVIKRFAEITLERTICKTWTAQRTNKNSLFILDQFILSCIKYAPGLHKENIAIRSLAGNMRRPRVDIEEGLPAGGWCMFPCSLEKIGVSPLFPENKFP